MGKIGDLFVRLGLKSDDYKKGMESAKKETRSFSQSLGKMKAGAVAVWAAIGTAVVSLAKDFIASSNQMSDAWERNMRGIKAAWQTVKTSLLNFDFKNFRKNITDAFKAGKEAANAFDAEFELVNSIKLQKGAIQQELNELYIMMRDTTLSPQQRKAAAERYKALLQPIADAEVRVYQNMLSAAIKEWQAGSGLDREYSAAEMTEFFTKIGTEYEKMQEKFPDLMSAYEKRKGDAQNQIIFDTLAKLQQAVNQMSDIDRQLSRVTLSINRAGAGAGTTSKNYLGMGKLDALGGISAGAVSLSAPGLMTDEWLREQMENGQAYGEWYKTNVVDKLSYLNGMLESSMVAAFSNGMQAFTDMLFGIEGADASQVMAAILQPIAQTATRLGEMLIAEGLAIDAFKESLLELKGAKALAAGAALLAIGAAMSSGIRALGRGSGGTSATTIAGGSSGISGMETYAQDITVHVVGEISGDKIIIAGQKTLNKWNR